MHLGIHLCRGNYMGSRHFSSGAYDKIALSLFTHLDADTFYLEYDTPRAGGFEPLQHLPEGKNVVLGVVTSKFPELEDQKEMVERIYSAADEVVKGRGGGCTREDALKQLSVSPQCGFASHAEVSYGPGLASLERSAFVIADTAECRAPQGNSLTREDMINKLKLVRAIADEVWPGQA
jgi:methionine synthase II (cobalamin-independent)